MNIQEAFYFYISAISRRRKKSLWHKKAGHACVGFAEKHQEKDILSALKRKKPEKQAFQSPFTPSLLRL
jgi:hypothetical protein